MESLQRSAPPSASPPIREELRSLDRRRRALIGQAIPMVGAGFVLVLGAGGLAGAPVDLQFLFLAATGLYSLATVHWVDETLTILHADCPRCARRFFGGAPEGLPSPLRRRCRHCGLSLSQASAEPR